MRFQDLKNRKSVSNCMKYALSACRETTTLSDSWLPNARKQPTILKRIQIFTPQTVCYCTEVDCIQHDASLPIGFVPVAAPICVSGTQDWSRCEWFCSDHQTGFLSLFVLFPFSHYTSIPREAPQENFLPLSIMKNVCIVRFKLSQSILTTRLDSYLSMTSSLTVCAKATERTAASLRRSLSKSNFPRILSRRTLRICKVGCQPCAFRVGELSNFPIQPAESLSRKALTSN